MKAKEYGVCEVTFSNAPDKTWPCVQFGDGLTSIITLDWPDEVGIKFKRFYNGITPFSPMEYFNEHNPEPTAGGDELYLFFDNSKSIDALIERLGYIKDKLVEKETSVIVLPVVSVDTPE